MLTTSVPPQNMIYYINWITPKEPMEIDNGRKIVNGMSIDVSLKDGGSSKQLTTFLYDNEGAQFYLLKDQNKFAINLKIDTDSLKKIRNNCFLEIASRK
jgi:hypothetical protein